MKTRLALDCEDSVQWVTSPHLDIAVTDDADLRWELPSGVLLVAVRFSAGVCRLELRDEPRGDGAAGSGASLAIVPLPPPLRGAELPQASDLDLEVADLVVQLGLGPGEGAGVADARHRALAMHVRGARLHRRSEYEELEGLGRSAALRTLVRLRTELLSVADVGRPAPAPLLKQVLALPPLNVEVRIMQPPHGLPTSYELLRVEMAARGAGARGRHEAEADGGDSVIVVALDDGLLDFVQALGAALGDEMAVDGGPGDEEACGGCGEAGSAAGAAAAGAGAAPAPWPPAAAEEFKYFAINKLVVPPLPLCVDLQLASPVFLSFTGLTLTFPEALKLSDRSEFWSMVTWSHFD